MSSMKGDNMELKELFGNLSDEIKAKVKDVKSMEELKAILEKENVELTPEQVEALAGGGQGTNQCPFFDHCPLNW